MTSAGDCSVTMTDGGTLVTLNGDIDGSRVGGILGHSDDCDTLGSLDSCMVVVGLHPYTIPSGNMTRLLVVYK